MRKLSVCLLLLPAALLAQTADIAYFRAVMLTANETPPVLNNATGVADLIAHAVRDSSGQIVSGTVQFLVYANMPADVAAVGLHIHSGAAGVAGPVVINTGLSAANTLALKAGANTINRSAQIDGTNQAALDALRGLFTNPTQYYANLHTTEFPNGVIRGQLQPAIGRVLIGMMNADNEVPALNPPTTASGTAVVVAFATLDPNTGAMVTGETFQQTSYNLADRGTFTGFHIHPGAAGGTGPASLATTVPGTAIDPSGAGMVGPFYTEVNFTNAVQVQTFSNLFFNPAGDYINLHTNQHGGGVMRAQLRNTDAMVFKVVMDSANEGATTNLKGTAPAIVTVRTLRNEDGSVAAGTVFFDVNYRFPGATSFTGLHIHDGAAGVNGPISIPIVPNFDPNFTSDTGFGNYYNNTPAVTNLAALSDITINPENHYVNIHTTLDPSGTARAQLAPAVSALPVVSTNGVIAANDDKNATTVAPGSLISIYGTNLVKVSTGLAGWAGRVLPSSLNGTSVTIGGKSAPIVNVTPGQLTVQVPADVTAGPQTLVVRSVVGPSASYSVNVAATAPAIFFSPNPAVLKNADFSLVAAGNPARAGDVILVYTTGLGQTIPAMTTGALVPSTGNTPTAVPVTATIGDRPANVVYAIASPGFVGLYQVALVVPAGVTGSSAIVLKQGTTTSNSVSIAVQ